MGGAAGDDYMCIVSNIPPETSNEAMETAFSCFGEVIDSKNDFEHHTGKTMEARNDCPSPKDYYKCIVSNIPVETSIEALCEAFSNYGEVINAKIHANSSTGAALQIGYLNFKEKKAMESAILHMNGKLFNGEILEVYDIGSPRIWKLASDGASSEGSSGSSCVSQQDDYGCIVGNIPLETTNKELLAAFSHFGEVISAKIDINPATGVSFGVGTVTFKYEDDRNKAILGMHLKEFYGKILEVYDNCVKILNKFPGTERTWEEFGPDHTFTQGISESDSASQEDYYRCIVCNIPKWTSTEALWKAFSDSGKVISVKIFVNSSTGCQIGYVTFSEKEAMENAIQDMNDKIFNGELLKVYDEAVYDEDVGDSSPGVWKQLESDGTFQPDDYGCIVDNIPPETSIDELVEAFSVFGEVIEAEIYTNAKTGESFGVGTVTFKDEDGRDKAILGMDLKEFNGKILEVYDNSVNIWNKMYPGTERTWEKFGPDYTLTQGISESDCASQQDYFKCIVRNIPVETSNEALWVAFSEFGKVINAQVHADSRTGESCKNGYVIFKEKESMESAIQYMNGTHFNGEVLEVYGEAVNRGSGSPQRIRKKLRFDGAYTPGSSGSDCASQQDDYICIVHNIPMETSNEALEAAFSDYGEVNYAKIYFEHATGKSMGVGSVSFKNERERNNAILGMDGKEFNGKIIEVCRFPRSGGSSPRMWKQLGSDASSPHDDYKCIIIVNNIPMRTYIDELEAAFSKFGKVIHAMIHVDSSTGPSLHTGYVTYNEEMGMDGKDFNRKTPEVYVCDYGSAFSQWSSASSLPFQECWSK